MARCGRCGLWSDYPDDHKEQKYAGVCLWFGHRLTDDEVYDSRECDEGMERVPGLTSLQHFEFKVKRDDLGKAYTEAKRAKHLAYASMALSIAGLLIGIIKFVAGWGA